MRELWDLLGQMVALVDKTAELLEEAAPSQAECGYWNRDEKDAYEAAKRLVALRPILEAVETGVQPSTGLRWAKHGQYRVVAYAEGGYCCQRHVQGPGWCLLAPGQEMPADVERALCLALCLEYRA
jgi:hypothetical protein